jgi:hypothetical protein
VHRHGDDARDTEDQGKAKEVPFLPEPIDVYTAKEFH